MMPPATDAGNGTLSQSRNNGNKARPIAPLPNANRNMPSTDKSKAAYLSSSATNELALGREPKNVTAERTIPAAIAMGPRRTSQPRFEKTSWRLDQSKYRAKSGTRIAYEP